jgi:hypothetical protein
VFHAGKAAQLCLVGSRSFICRWARKNDFGSGSVQPWPVLVGGDCSWVLAEQGQPDGGHRRDHSHANLPRIQNNKGSGLTTSHDGSHARRSLWWCSIHMCDG